jgi:hypothetical protein
MAVRYSLKPLGDQCWLLTGDGDRIGLVNKINGEINVIGRLEPKHYADLAALETRLGGRLEIEAMTVNIREPELGNIDGYPVKHNTFFDSSMDPVPNYARTAKGRDRYAAGYYALRFPQGWTNSFCPRLNTLGDYEHAGPFKTKLEMQHYITTKNKEKTI